MLFAVKIFSPLGFTVCYENELWRYVGHNREFTQHDARYSDLRQSLREDGVTGLVFRLLWLVVSRCVVLRKLSNALDAPCVKTKYVVWAKCARSHAAQ